MKWFSKTLWYAIPQADRDVLAAQDYPAPPCVCPPCPVVPPPGPVTPPAPETSLNVAPGVRLERRLQVPCWVEYRLTGKLPSVEDGSARDGAHLAWAYSQEWAGGNVSPGGGYVLGVRDYALKGYRADGTYAGQVRYSGGWDPARTYLVRVEIGRDRARLLVDGRELARLDAAAPDEVTLGIGWPPSVRPGCDGAVLSGIRWSNGPANPDQPLSTLLNPNNGGAK